MTVTLDEQPLHLDALDESFVYVKSEWDAWVSSAYTRKMKVFGIIEAWALTCHEYNVPWASSAAKHMEDLAVDATVALVIDVQGTFSGSDKLHQIVSTNVKIVNLTVAYDKTDVNYRRFTVTVQAV